MITTLNYFHSCVYVCVNAINLLQHQERETQYLGKLDFYPSGGHRIGTKSILKLLPPGNHK